MTLNKIIYRFKIARILNKETIEKRKKIEKERIKRIRRKTFKYLRRLRVNITFKQKIIYPILFK